eukprot:gnl/MRDRNA2_/MRDRNA2_75727_c0_seq1.p3 gnl/MRDRNA2_/MRDRNA2_75727_c0~~gnl/MRDRNA2_/MRDRNA2_75727_c0_seq1.p3  ORF type:complete len:102 (+),score=4.94 gnl/MRDRNA2_/MRDRNA2_75727_c0_seq1:1054-1359(+)
MHNSAALATVVPNRVVDSLSFAKAHTALASSRGFSVLAFHNATSASNAKSVLTNDPILLMCATPPQAKLTSIPAVSFSALTDCMACWTKSCNTWALLYIHC